MTTTRPLGPPPDHEPHARRWRVLKFGGTSVAGSQRLEVIARVVGERSGATRPVVVVSAMSGVTDQLRRAAEAAATGAAGPELERLGERHRLVVHEWGRVSETEDGVEALLAELGRLLHGVELVGECSGRTLDHVLSIGERLSALLVAGALQARGVPAYAVDAADLVVTDGHHGEAEVDFASTEKAVARVLGRDDRVPVVTGFIGATASGERTTLGRGGSDYSAAVLGWALRAEEVEIWTDVDGVMTADPRMVPGARPLRGLGFAELLELSHWGARVVHPKTVRPLREREIPLVIRNTMSPDDVGTRVGRRVDAFRGGPVRGIASIERVSLLQLNGFGHGGSSMSARFLAALEDARCKVLLVSQACSERSVCAAVPTDSLEAATRQVARAFELERRAGLMDDLAVEDGCALIAVVGEGMKDTPGIAGRVFAVLGEEGVNVRAIAQGSSELNISFVVRSADAARAVRAIHDTFFGEGAAARSSSTPAGAAALVGTLDVVELTRELVAIPSVTGSEEAVTAHVAALLADRGWDVRLQNVAGRRANVWASRGGGEVTLSTHLDTVPGVVELREDGARLYGRGACDAKGIAAAMIVAADRLAAAGEERVDLLFVVGEEGGSDGARIAGELPATSRFLVNGEPTESKLVRASKGSQRLLVRTRGREAHSAYPEIGSSAVAAMLGLLHGLDGIELPVDPELGPTTLNVGVLRGGSAANVIAGACEAEIMIRLVSEVEPVRARLVEWFGDGPELEWGSLVPAMRFHLIDGFEETTVAYTSDVAFLGRWGTPLMFGPGSIHDAHTDAEHIDIAELRSAVDAYERIVRSVIS